MFRGDSETIEVEIIGVDVDGNEEAEPLTDTEIRFTLREKDDEEPPTLEKANTLAGGSDDEIKVTDILGGLCEIYILATDSNITPAKYVYDVELINGGLGTKTVVKGFLTIVHDVTIH